MNIFNNKPYWLYLVCALIIFYAFFYDYDISSLEYREGIVSEAKITGRRAPFRKGPSGDYGNIKIMDDTIVYCYTWVYTNEQTILSFNRCIIDNDYLKLHGIKEGDIVGIWFKPNEKNSCEVYMKNSRHDDLYERYRYRILPEKDTYAINIRGLTINNRVILKPQHYNYVRTDNFFIMGLAQFIILIICMAVLVELFFYIVNKLKNKKNE